MSYSFVTFLCRFVNKYLFTDNQFIIDFNIYVLGHFIAYILDYVGGPSVKRGCHANAKNTKSVLLDGRLTKTIIKFKYPIE